ncbi:MAG: TonB-dependent receptor, partial [Tissierellales bacterium]
LDASYGRFNEAELGGYISGALSPTLNARLSASTTHSDGWQKSTTRSDELGEKDQFVGRLLLDWTPTDRLNIGLNLNGWRDKSESLAPQAIGITTLTHAQCPTNPSTCLPAYAADVPLNPSDPRDADWDPGLDYKHDDHFYQGVARIDFDLSDQLTLTSITSYAKYEQEFWNDHDGTQFNNTSAVNKGEIENLFQEIRLGLSTENGFDIVIGASYQHDEIEDFTNDNFVRDSSTVNLISPAFPIYSFRSESLSDITTRAIFGNVEYKLSDKINVHAGMRYTDVEVDNSACNADSGDGSNAGAFNAIIFGLTGAFGTVTPGDCVTLNSIYPDPSSPTGLGVTTGYVKQTLKEDNVSWRVGIDYMAMPDIMLYGNISQGYKSGSFPNLGGTAAVQYMPATQEKVIAYEIGTKSTLADGRVQLDAAAFYYDYSDKQVRGRVQDPLGIFGALEALVNVPDSRLYGAEVQLNALPMDGLAITAGLTYLNSEVTKDFYNFDPYGNSINFKGKRYPYTPTWSFVGDAEYTWEIGRGLNAFIGASAYAQSAVVAAFRERGVIGATPSDPANLPGQTVSSDIQDIAGYAVFDARAGLADPNGSWRVMAWVRNLDNKLYATNVSYAMDFTFRTVGMPRTYGISASYKF